MPHLQDELGRFVLGKPDLEDLRTCTATTQYPIPDIVPPFHLKRLEVGHQLQDNVFGNITSTSQQTLESLTVPFSLDLVTGLEPFSRLRHLCLEFSSYGWHNLAWCHERLARIKTFLQADSRIVTLTFSHASDWPRSNRIRTIRSALPPNLETLVLYPWPMHATDAIKCLDVGIGKHLWPATLRKVVWTSESVCAPWTNEEVELVRQVGLEYGLPDVAFRSWRTAIESS